jgi:hypothetical protein
MTTETLLAMTKEDQLIQALLQHEKVFESADESPEDIARITTYEAAMRSRSKLVSTIALFVRQAIVNGTQEATTFTNLRAHLNA